MDNQNPTDPNQGGMPVDPNLGGQPGGVPVTDPNAGQPMPEAPVMPENPVMPETPASEPTVPQQEPANSGGGLGGDQGGTPAV